MCRWLAYSGSPLLLDELLYKPKHSLIDQSLHARQGPHMTNGDGFGVGWYGDGPVPATFKGVDPIWSNRNLRELSGQVRSGLVFAHIRASTGTAIQQTNCHPFRHRNWLWMHNGQIAGFQMVKRQLAMAVDPALFPLIEGSSDTELFFYLALTFGLERDPPLAVQRAVSFIEEICGQHGIAEAIRMSVATSDGQHIWAFRYSTEGIPPSLYYSTNVETLREQYPESPIFQNLSVESRLVVSEPLGDLVGAWNEVAPSSYGQIKAGQDALHPFMAA